MAVTIAHSADDLKLREKNSEMKNYTKYISQLTEWMKYAKKAHK